MTDPIPRPSSVSMYVECSCSTMLREELEHRGRVRLVQRVLASGPGAGAPAIATRSPSIVCDDPVSEPHEKSGNAANTSTHPSADRDDMGAVS
jgi:hypothetical protein